MKVHSAAFGSALSSAVYNGHYDVAKLLLERGAYPNPPVESSADALSIAMMNKDDRMIELLCSYGAARSVDIMSYYGDVEKAAMFIDHGADLHARDEDICSTPLGWAAKYGKIQMVELLLSRGAKLSLPDDPPWATPIAWAKRKGHSEVVEVLSRYDNKVAN